MNSSDAASDWRVTLMKIIEELNAEQYKKMVSLLTKIPGGKREAGRTEMADIIIETYGSGRSITEIRRVMSEIPRNDDKILGYLLPYVQKLEKTNKQNPSNESFQDQFPAANLRKRKYDKMDAEVSGQVNKQNNPHSTIIPIAKLKSFGELGEKGIQVKVITKSQLVPYKTKEGNKTRQKFFT
ncbi:hypothetical protein DPEC_G00221620, partial [Dallia pectoralis]